MTTGKWLSGDDLAALAQIAPRVAKRAIAAGRWRGAELEVRKVEVGRGGAGGVVPQVHVDSLPADLREAWYAARGIALHEKRDAATGQVLLVDPSIEHDARHDARLAVARWRHDVIRPALALPRGSKERGTLIEELAAVMRMLPSGQRGTVSRPQIYRWIAAYESDRAGLIGLMPKESALKGQKRVTVTRTWDSFFASLIDTEAHNRVAEDLTHYIRSLWASGERGKYAVSEKATTRLIEMTRGLRVLDFDRLALGRPVANSGMNTQFEVCFVNTRRAAAERKFSMIAVKNKDNARWQDEFMPHIRRDYSGYKPREIVVGDVHPTDVMMHRADGSEVYPKAISWFDVATNEIHMTFVMLEPGEGVRREHIAMSFEAMVSEWGLPKLLYLDNGSEYKDANMLDGFTRLSKMTSGAFAVHDLADGGEVDDRLSGAREAVVRSLAYNAKGKPGIEGAFGNLEKVHFAILPGWTSGDRMRKKTHAKGKAAKPFDGTPSDFLRAASTVLENYHKRPQGGKLGNRSPNEALGDFINEGWGKTELSNPDVLRLAFAEELQRIPRSGRISYKTRHGDRIMYYHDRLIGIHHEITVRVPAWKPDAVFCFDGEEPICVATRERTYGILERAGAEELGRRRKVFTREVTEMQKGCVLLDLVTETDRHNAWLPVAPEAPIAALVSTPMLDRMKEMDAEERARLAAPEEARREPSQWGRKQNAALAAVQFTDEETDARS